MFTTHFGAFGSNMLLAMKNMNFEGVYRMKIIHF
jgi:hypothetical protein